MTLNEDVLEVMRFIRGWSNTDPNGPTASQILTGFVGRRARAQRALGWLKSHRMVSWTPEGNRTRYRMSQVPRS